MRSRQITGRQIGNGRFAPITKPVLVIDIGAPFDAVDTLQDIAEVYLLTYALHSRPDWTKILPPDPAAIVIFARSVVPRLPEGFLRIALNTENYSPEQFPDDVLSLIVWDEPIPALGEWAIERAYWLSSV